MKPDLKAASTELSSKISLNAYYLLPSDERRYLSVELLEAVAKQLVIAFASGFAIGVLAESTKLGKSYAKALSDKIRAFIAPNAAATSDANHPVEEDLSQIQDTLPEVSDSSLDTRIRSGMEVVMISLRTNGMPVEESQQIASYLAAKFRASGQGNDK